VPDVLDLTSHLPEVEFARGDLVVLEGSPAGELWVLVSGALQVRRGDLVVNTITEPGAVIGEVSVLLGGDHGASVAATEPSRLRYAADGRSLLAADAAVTQLVAVGLAQRLSQMTTYLADLEQQYGAAPGMSMVSEVLQDLAHHQGPDQRPTSARDPHPEY
jgi:CRP/FNR family transcriptional regulator, cyclic AMP receptor protein